MYDTILKALQEHGLNLISWGSKLNPFAGVGIAVLLLIAVVVILIFKDKDSWNSRRREDGENIGRETGDNQDTNDSVDDRLDDFLKGRKK